MWSHLWLYSELKISLVYEGRKEGGRRMGGREGEERREGKEERSGKINEGEGREEGGRAGEGEEKKEHVDKF